VAGDVFVGFAEIPIVYGAFRCEGPLPAVLESGFTQVRVRAPGEFPRLPVVETLRLDVP
jgi:hypothetical protein